MHGIQIACVGYMGGETASDVQVHEDVQPHVDVQAHVDVQPHAGVPIECGLLDVQ